MGPMIKYTLLCFFFYSSTVFLTGIDATVCPKTQYVQHMSCRPGQGISTMKWKEDTTGCNTYSIKCQNVTSSCEEYCTWEDECHKKQFPYYGNPYYSHSGYNQKQMGIYYPLCYVRALFAFVQQNNGKQHVKFLCCVANRTNDTHTGQFIVLNGTNQAPKDSYIRQTRSTQLSTRKYSIVPEYCKNNYSVHLCSPCLMNSNVGPGGVASQAGGQAGQGGGHAIGHGGGLAGAVGLGVGVAGVATALGAGPPLGYRKKPSPS